MHVAIFIAAMLLASSAWGDFKPLTRAEAIVRMVLQEAANEPFDGTVAVAGVALDRVVDARWPDTEYAVVYQRAQFTSMALPLRHYSQEQVVRAREAVGMARLGDRPCGTVLWYHTIWVAPRWDYGKIEIACLQGVHLFYRDKEK